MSRRLSVAMFLLSGILVAGCGGQEGWLRAKQACADRGTSVASYNMFSGNFRCAPATDAYRVEQTTD